MSSGSSSSSSSSSQHHFVAHERSLPPHFGDAIAKLLVSLTEKKTLPLVKSPKLRHPHQGKRDIITNLFNEMTLLGDHFYDDPDTISNSYVFCSFYSPYADYTSYAGDWLSRDKLVEHSSDRNHPVKTFLRKKISLYSSRRTHALVPNCINSCWLFRVKEPIYLESGKNVFQWFLYAFCPPTLSKSAAAAERSCSLPSMSSATGLGRPRTPNMFRSAENIVTPMHQFPVRLQMMIQDLASEISHAIGRFHEHYNELADSVNQSAGYITLKPLDLNRLSNPEEMVRVLMPHDLSFIPDPFSDPRMAAMNDSFKNQRPGGLPSPPRPVSRSTSANHDLSRSAKRQRRPASPGPEEASAFTPLMTLSSLSASLLDDPKSLSEVQTSPNIEEPLFPMDDWEELKMIKEMASSHIVLRPEYDTSSRFTPLHRAIAESAMNSDPASLSRLEELIKNVQDPFLPDRNGWTPLQVAAFHGNEKGVTLLLQHGHPIDARTLNGMTPLHFATLLNRIDVMYLLLQHGHPVTPKNDEGATPLYYAAMNNAPDAMALLIRHGHPITVATNMGATPLHAAAFHNSTLAIDVLVQCDHQVDIQDKNGMTPLHWAALNNSVKAIELLVRNKHSIDVRDYRGRTPIQIAATCDQQDSSKALGNLRADICGLTKLRGGNGISPIPAYPFNSQNADVQVS